MAKGYILAIQSFLSNEFQVNLTLPEISAFSGIPYNTLYSQAKKGIKYEHYIIDELCKRFEITVAQQDGDEMNNIIVSFRGNDEATRLNTKKQSLAKFEKFFFNGKVQAQFPKPSLINSVFIATPMNATKDEKEYSNLKNSVKNLITSLESKEKAVYCGITSFPNRVFSSSGAGFSRDVEYRIARCDLFIAIFHKKISSGVLIELGMALSQHKNCIVFCHNRNDLPTLFQDWATSSYDALNVRIIEVTDIAKAKDEIEKNDFAILNSFH